MGCLFGERLGEGKELIARRKLHDTRQRTPLKFLPKKESCLRSDYLWEKAYPTIVMNFYSCLLFGPSVFLSAFFSQDGEKL